MKYDIQYTLRSGETIRTGHNGPKEKADVVEMALEKIMKAMEEGLVYEDVEGTHYISRHFLVKGSVLFAE